MEEELTKKIKETKKDLDVLKYTLEKEEKGTKIYQEILFNIEMVLLRYHSLLGHIKAIKEFEQIKKG